jgi:hypothetical protein
MRIVEPHVSLKFSTIQSYHTDHTDKINHYIDLFNKTTNEVELKEIMYKWIDENYDVHQQAKNSGIFEFLKENKNLL